MLEFDERTEVDDAIENEKKNFDLSRLSALNDWAVYGELFYDFPSVYSPRITSEMLVV